MADTIILNKKHINRLQSMDYAALAEVIPSTAGLLLFRENASPLFHVRTNNLTMLFDRLFRKKTDPKDSNLEKVYNRFNCVELLPAEDSFKALVQEKRLLAADQPEFYRYIRLSDNYVYLGITIKKPPYITIQQDTMGEDWYIGPFQDRFMLVDVIETFTKYTGSPACQPYFTDTEPKIGVVAAMSHQAVEKCNRKNRQQNITDLSVICPAYCDNPDGLKPATVLAETYITENEALMTKLQNFHRQQYDNLQFNKAEEIKAEINHLRQYYDTLRFLTVTKDLDHCFTEKGVTFYIKDGVLSRINEENKTELFDAGPERVFKEYRENETLAIPKDRFQEMRTVYDKLYLQMPEYISELYDYNKTKIINLFTRSIYEN